MKNMNQNNFKKISAMRSALGMPKGMKMPGYMKSAMDDMEPVEKTPKDEKTKKSGKTSQRLALKKMK